MSFLLKKVQPDLPAIQPALEKTEQIKGKEWLIFSVKTPLLILPQIFG
jgi:hypothetical protein